MNTFKYIKKHKSLIFGWLQKVSKLKRACMLGFRNPFFQIMHSISWKYCPWLYLLIGRVSRVSCANPSRPNPGRWEKIKWNFYFNTTFRNARDVKGSKWWKMMEWFKIWKIDWLKNKPWLFHEIKKSTTKTTFLKVAIF